MSSTCGDEPAGRLIGSDNIIARAGSSKGAAEQYQGIGLALTID